MDPIGFFVHAASGIAGSLVLAQGGRNVGQDVLGDASAGLIGGLLGAQIVAMNMKPMSGSLGETWPNFGALVAEGFAAGLGGVTLSILLRLASRSFTRKHGARRRP